MQPGDNIRAVATLRQDALSQSTQADADALSVTKKLHRNGNFSGWHKGAYWSQMLTVWRKLHVEVDSMGKESFVQGDRELDMEWTRFIAAPVSSTVPAPVQLNTPNTGLTTVLGYLIPNGNPCDSDFENRWEGGAFIPTLGGPQFQIVRNVCHTTSDGQVLTKFIIFGDPGDITDLTITIHDDDLVPPAGGAAQLPQTSVITNDIVAAYRDAYIEIVEATPTENPDNIVPWRSNLSRTRLITSYILGNLGSGVGGHRDLDSASDFWIRRVLVCYQPGEGEDMDSDPFENGAISQNLRAPVLAPYPVAQLSFLGSTSDDNLMGFTQRSVAIGTALSTVYKETIRDIQIDQFSVQFWQIVAHESGHATLDPSGNRISEAAEHAEGGLMTEGGNLQVLPELERFSPTTLVRFRNVSKW